MLTFYHSPQSCSNGILLLLHEVGAAFETRIIDLRAAISGVRNIWPRTPRARFQPLGFRTDRF
ncbi:hypothetical protein ACFQFQ_28425 [Sulfitobacter porphyrae]|uniref:GST N-terminal domain-containing protein n=1 Tax=Sulfitobacter porphyrae TaxID=1246864 RepID=A0ABW2BAV0_9RHOB